MQETGVLIVGAGPTGLALALELSLQNVPFRIISKDAIRSDKSRALVIHSRTQELLDRHPGVTDELLRRGTAGQGIRFFVNKKHVTDANVDDLGFDDTAFPKPMWVSQAETEQVLESKLEEYAGTGKVESPFTIEDIRQDDDGVTATIVTLDDGENGVNGVNGDTNNSSNSRCRSNAPNTEPEHVEKLRCKYLVGCDGAHSTVRGSAGMTLAGHTYPQHFVLCDAKLSGDYAQDRVSFFLAGRRVMVFFPLKDGIVRIFGERAVGESNDADPDMAEMQAFVDEMFPEATGDGDGDGDDAKRQLSDPVWLAHFRLHCRGVTEYRQGRIFVAGDAAHIHSPAGGQGMNTGIQDAVNLGWKMGVVLRGEEGDGFLDSYHEERYPVGEYLLRGTDRMFSWMASQNPLFVAFRNTVAPWVLPYALGTRERRTGVFRFVSQLGIRYRRSPIVGTGRDLDGPVKGGWRAPDGEVDGGDDEKKSLLSLCSAKQHTVLLFSGADGGGPVGRGRLEEATRKFKASQRFGRVEPVKIYQYGLSTGKDSVPRGGYGDADGQLHRRYGMKDDGGVVVVRPDYYVEYIGPLSSVVGLLASEC